ncbi:MAG: hypothetical protein FJY79_07475 [Candidatus Aminicenantes bacterium]|nr:hypothetical protein [Candidatus Aminicenantes bacterium]
MLFVIITALAVAGTFLALAFHRFWTGLDKDRTNLVYVALLGQFWAWLARRSKENARKASMKAWWAYLKALPLWRLPVLEKWLFVFLYGSFLYLAASGFFFAVFVPRGLHGFPLIGHVMAGGLFAVCLTLVVVFKGRNFTSIPEPLELSLKLFDPKRLGLTAVKVKHAAFWAFILAGFLLTLSSLLPMMPLLRTPGQKLMFELHRASALASVLAAMVFAGMGSLEKARGSQPR